MEIKRRFIPILFSTEMVKAKTDNNKTQTRRLKGLESVNVNPSDWEHYSISTDEKHRYFHFKRNEGSTVKAIYIKCPYKVGDILWVREKFAPKEINEEPPGLKAHYFASDCDASEKWKPSIFMTKKLCRIFLEIKNVRIERLQNISEEDSIAEGCSKYGPFGEYKGSLHPNGGSMRYRAYQKASRAFQCIWETINGEESWKINPWIWVIEFKEIEKPLDFSS